MEEEVFDINRVVKYMYDALAESCEHGSPGLTFMFSKHLPCRMKGNEEMLMSVLFQLVYRLMLDNCKVELLLSLEAPADFVYREPVTFKITNLPMKKESIHEELMLALADELKALDATLEYSSESGGSLVLTVPLSTEDMGERRHYRLPSSLMLHKNILLVLNSTNDAMALTKMFRYFPMNVDLSMKRLQPKYELEKYDMVVIDSKLYEGETADLLNTASGTNGFELVIYGEKPAVSDEEMALLERPVTQQDILDLLVSQFWVKPRETADQTVS